MSDSRAVVILGLHYKTHQGVEIKEGIDVCRCGGLLVL